MTGPGMDPGVMAAIRHGFANLLNFSGRDTRRQFWSYAAFLLILGGAAVSLAYLPASMHGYLRLLDYTMTHPAPGTPPDASGFSLLVNAERPELRPYYGRYVTSLCVIGLVHIALLAAALARRRHDRDWSEAAAALSLPVTVVILAFAPRVLPLALGLIGFAGILYALIRGGAPERIGAAIYLVGFILYFVVIVVSPPISFRGVEPRTFAIDTLSFLALLLLAARANRFWPIWVVAFNGLGLAAHVAVLVSKVPPWAYMMAWSLWSYPILATMIAGTRAHRIRLARDGSDPAWVERRPAGENAS